MKPVQLDAADVLLFRDGRPFGEAEGANIARSLPLPLPSTLAGAVRSFIGDQEPGTWGDHHKHQRIEQIKVYGPLLRHTKHGVLFPAPADVLRTTDHEKKSQWHRLIPGKSGSSDLPEGLVPLTGMNDGKPDADPYWPESRLIDWLLGKELDPEFRGMKGPQSEERTHVGIDSALNKADEGKLFGVRFLDFGLEWSLLAQVETTCKLEGATPLGGENRLVYLSEGASWPQCPNELKKALTSLQKGDLVRMVLATPALFTAGWKPGWLKWDPEQRCWAGSPPIPNPPKLALMAAAVPRRQPISGWELRQGQAKPVRWAVPAGAVYFFEVLVPGLERSTLADAWLAPVSDNNDNSDKNRRDGFGLAVWGTLTTKKDSES